MSTNSYQPNSTWGHGPFENTRASNWLDEFTAIMADNLMPMLSQFLKESKPIPAGCLSPIDESDTKIDVQQVYAAIEMMRIVGTESPIMFNAQLMDLAMQCAHDILNRSDWFDKFDKPAEVRVKVAELYKWIRDNHWACTLEPITVNAEKIRKDTTQFILRKESRMTMKQAKEAQQREADEMLRKSQQKEIHDKIKNTQDKMKEETRISINRQQRGLKP